ncbi:DUF2292 domain-containing protein [Streptococcus suis]|uniref:DUF2292 domain-containing protein n=1 Tax=Streptococcus suis TaxID=1307 RepID=UPI00039C0B88|nr:DUF2292 domain-containing protein [Streptococcus suis]QBX11612.1 hypothetical protein JavanS595_0008 [Streptococcus satellite phage Javan595]MBY4959097.1 DUF2292 domain-containing protein [Streptococcus suis]MBY5027235.1 DUF2292 domain-containing protein [Streptococcus suis]MBY6287535.1 DUF2292 domain-containing protein [Streptococcus suis]MBY6294702.1 DUF2292 domain-containing protein [Streptococcus suis]
MNIEKGFIYFRENGIISLLEIPRYGQVVLKSQDGEIVSSESTERKQYTKRKNS